MAAPVKVLTENAAPIPDVTPEVKAIAANVAVSQEQHSALQTEADANAVAITELQRVAKDAAALIAQAAADAVAKLKEAAGTASEKVTDTATQAATEVTTINQGRPLKPTTTEEQNTVSAGQRRINLIWEVTQGLTAIGITGAVIYCSIYKIDAPVLTNAFFLIVSMYFVRTNHTLTGGVGAKIGEVQVDAPMRAIAMLLIIPAAFFTWMLTRV